MVGVHAHPGGFIYGKSYGIDGHEEGKGTRSFTEVDRIVLSGVKLVLQQIESVSQPSG
jgi:hypothetical protein